MKIHTDCWTLDPSGDRVHDPPVVLDAKPGMSVLDMCVAPGSKTCQLVEVVGGMNHHRDDEITQLRRLQSPNVFVTSCDGRVLSDIDEKKDKGTEMELCVRILASGGIGIKSGALALHPLSVVHRFTWCTCDNWSHSTCSMNPMENESVMAELLRITNGFLVLEDPSSKNGRTCGQTWME
ncbi:hypothetical protein ACHAWO_005799 [Cyclotella atomus]|uniref:SAM-dependent MTase RsmB/NOP-type domain-containing protein n=1 Tax=Cyclotella atomus TaxID=382360 RepID=A0ABD3P0K3_9STRA